MSGAVGVDSSHVISLASAHRMTLRHARPGAAGFRARVSSHPTRALRGAALPSAIDIAAIKGFMKNASLAG